MKHTLTLFTALLLAPLAVTAQDAVAATLPKVAATETTGSVYAVSTGLSEGQYHYKTPGLLQIGRDLGNALITTSGQH